MNFWEKIFVSVLVGANIILAVFLGRHMIVLNQESRVTAALNDNVVALDQKVKELQQFVAVKDGEIVTLRKEIKDIFIDTAMTAQQSSTSDALKNLFVSITAPRDIKELCMGRKVRIEWKTSPEIKQVGIMLKGPNSYYDLGTYSASNNESGRDDHTGMYEWEIGKVTSTYVSQRTIIPGGGYVFVLSGRIPPQIRQLSSPGGDDNIYFETTPFSIAECRG